MKDEALEELVKDIQRHLASKGVKIIVDGVMGPKTYDAIRVRQSPKTKINSALSWRPAASIIKLRDQINAAYPKRDKSADGIIGDAAHQSRKSDHNPWVRDANGQPVVTAIDITHDPVNGVDCDKLAQLVILDPRVKYVIWEGKIFNNMKGRFWRPYEGKNPHNHHIHISVSDQEEKFDSTVPWRIV